MEKFGATFINKDGHTDAALLKEGKLVGLFFGAEYCAPFNRFLPNLVDFYNNVNADDKVFEILYFPFDQKASQFHEYFQDCPWLSYEFKDANKIKMYLEYKQHIKGIPCLLIINPDDGSVLTENGRGQVEKFGVEALEHWQSIPMK